MGDNKYKLMELFLYIILVVSGLILLLFGKAGPIPGGGTESPPAAEMMSVERSDPVAVLPDEQ